MSSWWHFSYLVPFPDHLDLLRHAKHLGWRDIPCPFFPCWIIVYLKLEMVQLPVIMVLFLFFVSAYSWHNIAQVTQVYCSFFLLLSFQIKLRNLSLLFIDVFKGIKMNIWLLHIGFVVKKTTTHKQKSTLIIYTLPDSFCMFVTVQARVQE